MAKIAVFEIADSFRVKNSPFFVEGTNIQFDVPNEVPLPTETVSLKNGKPRAIRLILESPTIDKAEQIKAGFPADRLPTDIERGLLTFRGGRIEINEDEYPQVCELLREAPWFEEYTGVRPPGSKVMYREYKKAEVEEQTLLLEELVIKAKTLILSLGRQAAVELLRLHNPGAIVSPQLELKTLKLRLLEIADTNPNFILDGAKTNHDKLVVLVSKGIDFGILNIDIAGILAMVDGDGQPQPITRMSDVGGRKAKAEKAVNFLESADGKPYAEQLAEKVKAYELVNMEADEPAGKTESKKGKEKDS